MKLSSKLLAIGLASTLAAGGFAAVDAFQVRSNGAGSEDIELSAFTAPANFEVISVTLESPVDGAAFEPGQAVNFEGRYFSLPGRLPQSFTFEVTGVVDVPGTPTSQTLEESFYAASWTPPGPGTYSIRARAMVIPPDTSSPPQGDSENESTAEQTPVPFYSSFVEITVLDVPNQPPSVSITTPEVGAALQAPAQIVATASASDPDGQVVSVTYTAPGLDTRVVEAAPYEATWVGVAAGSYTLTATATDNAGATATDTREVVVRLPADVDVTAPANGSVINVPEDVMVSATASHATGIESITFLRDGIEIGTSTSAPFSVTWSSPPAGTYSLTALALDGAGLQSPSDPIELIVNTRPTATLTAPADGSTFYLNDSINFGADASDPDDGDSVVEVRYVINGTEELSSTELSYAATWTPPGVGTYSIVARAVDTRGQTGDSSAVSVSVVAQPPNPNPVDPDPVSDAVGATAGEFRVDESGAASYQIPLLTAAGTAGVAPEMALSYSSQGGDGPMGRGWSISGTSAITRCRATPEAGDSNGFPAIGFNAEDRFCLDGQRLLQQPSSTCPSGPGGTSVVELRTEIESFQRVCAYTAAAVDGPRFFTVERRDGSLSHYGDFDGRNVRTDAVLRQAPGSNAGPIYVWSQTRFQDSTGNYIDHIYSRDPAGGEFPNEQVLSEVRYTGKLNLPGQGGSDQAPYASLRLHYDTLPLADRRQVLFAGTESWQTQRLSRIESINNGQVLREYRPDYGSSGSGSRAQLMVSFEECVGVGADALCLPPTIFDWAQDGSSFGDLEAVQSSGFDNLVSFRLGEIDGDGRLDLIWFRDQAGDGCAGLPLYVSYGQLDGSGRQSFGQRQYTGVCSQRDVESVDLGWQVFDYDGDGRDDVFVARSNSGNWELFLSQGDRTSAGPAFNVSNDRLAAASITIGINGNEALQPQFGDLDGDGVLDLVYSVGEATVAHLWDGTSTGWGAAREVRFEYEAGDEEACDFPNTSCDYATAPQLSTQAGYLQLVDLDGDSRSDMLFDSRRIRDYQIDGCTFDPFSTSTDGQVRAVRTGSRAMTEESSNPNFLDDPGPCEGRYTEWRTSAFSVSYVTASIIELKAYATWVNADRQQENYPSVPGPGDGGVESFDRSTTYLDGYRFADINGDGLTDVMMRRASGPDAGSWRVDINTGSGFFQLLDGELGSIPNSEQMQLVDIDGDGRADVVYPASGTNSPFQVRYGQIDGSFGPAQALPGGGAFGCPGNCNVLENVYLFADLSGDGRVEFARIRPAGGQLDISRAPPAARFQPRDVITRIENGMGALTLLDYAALNNSAVHRRGTNARSVLNVGRGSPVQDLTGPMFVVAKASSSSPGRLVSQNNMGAPDLQHLSSVYYRYEGARMQAGGRGFLGFEEVSSIDPNHANRHVVTRTRYSQAFPLVGMPLLTEKVVSLGDFAAPACLSTITDACFLGNTELSGFELSGRRLTSSTQVWDTLPVFSAAQQTPVQVRPAGTVESVFDYNDGLSVPGSGLVDSGVLTGVSTLFDYDVWGNVTLTEVSTHAGNPAQPESSVVTSNTYADDTARWRLGRLVQSTVTHTRGSDSIQRSTRFAYDMGANGTGMLVREEMQPDGAANEWLKTLYDLDEYGNRIATYTCAGTVSDAACRNSVGSFNRDDGLVHRQVFQDYDLIGRYPVATRELFWSNEGPIEAVTQEVLLRDRYGHPIRAVDVNGTVSIAVHGAFGRPFLGWQQSVENAEPGAAGDGVESFSLQRWCAGSAPAGQASVACPAGGVFRSESITSGAPNTWTYHDVLGREILTVSETFNAGVSGKDVAAVCTVFDDRGRTSSVSEPFFLGGVATSDGPPVGASTCGSGGAFRSTTTVDLIDRPVLMEGPDGSQVTMSYNGLSTTTVDARGNPRTDVSNALGELVLVEDAKGLEMAYGYDATGNLTTVTRDAGNGAIITVMEYDVLGRKVFMDDPDAGERSYTYNALGEQLEQIDSQGGRVEQSYDARGRVWRTRSLLPNGTVEVEHHFDFDTAPNGLGQLAAAESSGLYAGYTANTGRDVDFRQEMGFDSLGRVVQASTWIDDELFPAASMYDGLGRAWKSLDASGEWSKTEFDDRGFGVRTCASTAADSQPTCAAAGSDTWLALLETDARGQPVRERRGGVAAMDVTRTYDPATGRVIELCAGATCQLMEDTYEWDLAGNLQSRTRSNGSSPLYTEVFEHDALNRLTEGRFTQVLGIGVDVLSGRQVYDALGNICQRRLGGANVNYSYWGSAGCGSDGLPGGSGLANDAQRNPDIPGPGPGIIPLASPHAVAEAGRSRYAYDHRGNQTIRSEATTPAVTREINYTQQDQAYAITGGFTEGERFWYGPDGSRYKRESVRGQRKLYLGNVEVITAGAVTRTKRTMAGVFIEERTNGTVVKESYLFHDHLGSLVRVADTNGALLEGMDYGAFGDRRGYVDPRNTPTVPDTTERGFTGHEHLDGLDVIHMNGRIYDEQLGRFLQPDPVVQSPGNTQNHNRYTYVLNNPLAYTDPSGYFFKRLWNSTWFRTAAAIAITVWTGGAASGTWGFFGIEAGAITLGQGFAVAAGGGFAAGVVGGGGIKSGLIGAFSAVTFRAIGVQDWGRPAAMAAHATAGGVVSTLQGGAFGHGFVSAGLSKGVMSNINTGDVVKDGILTAIAGGAISEATGGKFRNGALTSAMQFAMNEIASRSSASSSFSDRAERYREMAKSLDEAGVDTVWFRAAADLNEHFSRQVWQLKASFSYSYLNDLGRHLYRTNVGTFGELMTGTINLSGQTLDNYLVDREQAAVQAYHQRTFGRNVPGHLGLGMNLVFDPRLGGGGAFLNGALRNGQRRVNQKFGGMNYWFESHRREMGYGVMEHYRGGGD